jgi:hypothetical protein
MMKIGERLFVVSGETARLTKVGAGGTAVHGARWAILPVGFS